MGSFETEIIPTIVFLFVLLLCIALTVTVFTIFASRKVAKAKFDKTQAELDYKERLLRQTLLAQENERKRIAQDIHDEISGKMNVINLYIQLLRNSWPKGTEEYESLTYIHQQGILASNSARDIAHNLLPPTLESFGLKAAIDEYMDQVNKTMALKANLQVTGDISRLSPEYQLHIFRIVQELINNSIKHSEATIAAFDMDFDMKGCRCCYKDNGKGFDMSTRQASGIGLQSIKSRIQFMNGMMTWLTSPGNGFQLNFEFYGNDSPGDN